jgi:hypothetical protein
MSKRPALVMAVLIMLGVFLLFWNDGRTLPIISPRQVEDAPAAITTTSFGTSDALPNALSDDDFWKMVSEFSERGGYFRYENFVSNERSYQEVIPALKKTARTGGVYLGVGPEQNFTYIAAIQPQMAFIIDIRRQNMVEMLIYKSLFEMAPTRADFVSLLFSRPRPRGLDQLSTAEDLFRAYNAVNPDRALYEENLRQIQDLLIENHNFGLTRADQKTITYVYEVFFSVGPDLSYSSVSPGPVGPSYAALMTLTDWYGKNWSYLATEESFQFVKELHRKNLIVPLVGDFAGRKTIRTVGRYLKDQNATVSAFYLSNVEMYILEREQWSNFCTNVASLPVDTSSTFIRFVLANYSRYVSKVTRGFDVVSALASMSDFADVVNAGTPPGYQEALRASYQ